MIEEQNGAFAAATPADDAAHLLIIDDDRRIRSLLSRYLQGEGYRVTTAETAADALRLLFGDARVSAAAEAVAWFRAHGRPADAARSAYWQASGLYAMEQSDLAAAALTAILDEIAGGLETEPDLAVRCLIALAMVSPARLAACRSYVSGTPTARP